jgi:hypothetical protein
MRRGSQPTSEELLRGFGVPSRLSEDVEHDTVLIHRAPKIVLHASDPDELPLTMPFHILTYVNLFGCHGLNANKS